MSFKDNGNTENCLDKKCYLLIKTHNIVHFPFLLKMTHAAIYYSFKNDSFIVSQCFCVFNWVDKNVSKRHSRLYNTLNIKIKQLISFLSGWIYLHIFFDMGGNPSDFFFLCPHHVACGMLAPQPGRKSVPASVEAWSLNHWTSGKSHKFVF